MGLSFRLLRNKNFIFRILALPFADPHCGGMVDFSFVISFLISWDFSPLFGQLLMSRFQADDTAGCGFRAWFPLEGAPIW